MVFIIVDEVATSELVWVVTYWFFQVGPADNLFTGVEALRLCADFCSHVTWNVWPDNGENDDDEEEDNAGGA